MESTLYRLQWLGHANYHKMILLKKKMRLVQVQMNSYSAVMSVMLAYRPLSYLLRLTYVCRLKKRQIIRQQGLVDSLYSTADVSVTLKG